MQVNVDIKPDGPEPQGRFILERRAGPDSPWEPASIIQIKDAEERSFKLQANERIVVEGEEVVIPVFVASQNAAMTIVGAASYAGIELPKLTSLNPATVAANAPATELHAIGEDFRADSVIVFDGNPLTTMFVSETEVTAMVSAPGAEAIVDVLVQTGLYPTEPLEFTFSAPV